MTFEDIERWCWTKFSNKILRRSVTYRSYHKLHVTRQRLNNYCYVNDKGEILFKKSIHNDIWYTKIKIPPINIAIVDIDFIISTIISDIKNIGLTL